MARLLPAAPRCGRLAGADSGMDVSPGASPILEDLRAQLDPPAAWQVVVASKLAGGWLGPIAADLAILAPGPALATLARTHLLVLVARPREQPDVHGRAAVGCATGSRRHADDRLALAAAADVPETWLVDLERGWTEVYRAPFDGRYRSRTLAYPGEEIVPLALTRTRVVPLTGVPL